MKPGSKPPTSKTPAQAHVAKTFSIKPWASGSEGEKVVEYAKSGTGKTTSAAQIPGAIFIGLDDGGRKIKNPLTGEDVNAIPGIESFQDLRDALHQSNLWEKGRTAVIDTVTKLEEFAEPYIFQHYKTSQGASVNNMRKYGWDGPAHMLDVFRLMLTDLDALVRKGVNVVLLAQLSQITVANAEGLDYLEDGPKLTHNKQYSVRNEICEWADHVFRIGYADFSVSKDSEKAKAGKVTQADATRCIFTGGAPHFIAKSRPINGYRIPAVIGFDSPTDDSLWKFVFEGAQVEVA